jgi:hypothetical protein
MANILLDSDDTEITEQDIEWWTVQLLGRYNQAYTSNQYRCPDQAAGKY